MLNDTLTEKEYDTLFKILSKSKDPAKQVYEWVKTGHINLRTFKVVETEGVFDK